VGNLPGCYAALTPHWFSFLTLSVDFNHTPVLSQELIQGLNLCQGGHYLDLTLGGGGHSELILSSAPGIQITAVDQDSEALAAAQIRLSQFRDRFRCWQGNFADYDPGIILFDGIVADLGVSSVQLDRPERGFSFRHEAPLDMRMDQRQGKTAADFVNTGSAKELADIFYHFGEERFSRRIANRILAQRPLHTTTQLAQVVLQALPHRPHRGIHPATRVFQALRIAVNQELASLDRLLSRSPQWLKPGGRIGIISFHSLEDRSVKHGFRNHPELQVLTKKPILPTATEIAVNPRARSAKLRFAERIHSELPENSPQYSPHSPRL
jgi:16S rRNA (cytosine1402-N4)-methyltransferase